DESKPDVAGILSQGLARRNVTVVVIAASNAPSTAMSSATMAGPSRVQSKAHSTMADLRAPRTALLGGSGSRGNLSSVGLGGIAGEMTRAFFSVRVSECTDGRICAVGRIFLSVPSGVALGSHMAN